MGDTFKYGLAVILGAAVGSAVTYKFLNKKYEKICQEEIDSVKEVWAEKYAELFDEELEDEDEEEEVVSAETVKVDTNKPSISEYASILKANEYTEPTNYSGMSTDEEEEEEEEEIEMEDGISVIDPDEFGEEEDYDTVVFYYTSDGLLITEDDELVEDMENKVGFRALETFGRYEDDAVHVKNDNIKTYFEILKDERKYSEMHK